MSFDRGTPPAGSMRTSSAAIREDAWKEVQPDASRHTTSTSFSEIASGAEEKAAALGGGHPAINQVERVAGSQTGRGASAGSSDPGIDDPQAVFHETKDVTASDEFRAAHARYCSDLPFRGQSRLARDAALRDEFAVSRGGASVGAGREMPRFRLLLVGTSIFGVGCTLAAFAPGYWFFAGALVIIGAAALTFTNTTNSLMQLSTEPAMRGRVMALRVGIALGGAPIGAPIVGWVAGHCGPRWALSIGAASGFAAAVVALVALGRRPSDRLD